MMPTKISAVIVAAGRGERMGDREVPKQYLDLGGVPMLGWSVAALSGSELIEELVIVASEDWIGVARKIAELYCGTLPLNLAPGGRLRQDSVRAGLEAASRPDLVVIHDAARPFVISGMAECALDAAQRHGAATAALQTWDTIKLIDEESGTGKNLPRRLVRIIQTPQAFRADLLREAHEKARQDDYQATDDTELVERLGHKPEMIEGSPLNLKITDFADLELARSLVQGGVVCFPGEADRGRQ